MHLNDVKMLATLALAGAAFLALNQAPASSSEDPIDEHVVIARASGAPVIIWDAVVDVRLIVKEKLADRAANDRIERDGLRALASQIGGLKKTSTPVTLKIVYPKLGEFNPAYKTATLVGVESYAAITMDGKDTFGNRDKWMHLPSGRPIPTWIRYKVTGLLPPR